MFPAVMIAATSVHYNNEVSNYDKELKSPRTDTLIIWQGLETRHTENHHRYVSRGFEHVTEQCGTSFRSAWETDCQQLLPVKPVKYAYAYQSCQLQRAHNVLTASHSVHITFSQRPYSVHDALTAHKKLLQRAHGTLTERTRRALSARTALIAFKFFFTSF